MSRQIGSVACQGKWDIYYDNGNGAYSLLHEMESVICPMKMGHAIC